MLRFNTLNGMKTYFKKKGSMDFFRFKGLVYTMENYDNIGKELNYKNKKTTNQIGILTNDRYETYKDIKIEFEENVGFYRNDIVYMEDLKWNIIN